MHTRLRAAAGRLSVALWLMVWGLLAVLPAAAQEMRVAILYGQGKHHEIIRRHYPEFQSGKPPSSFVLMMLGESLRQIRDYERFFPVMDALDRSMAAGDRKWEGDDFSFMPTFLRGAAHLDLGELDKAERELTEAEARMFACIGVQKPRPSPGLLVFGVIGMAIAGHQQNSAYILWRIQIHGSLALTHHLLGHREASEAALARLQGVMVERSDMGPDKAIWLAKLHMARGDFAAALAALKAPEAKVWWGHKIDGTTKFQDLPKTFLTAKCLLETGQLAEARTAFDGLLAHPRIPESGGLHWMALADRARIAQRDGNLALAEAQLRQAVDLLDRQRASIPNEAGRIGFVGSKQQPYLDLVSLLVTTGKAAEAFEVAERAKGRALVDLLASQQGLTGRSVRARAGAPLLEEVERREREAWLLADPEQGASGTRGLALQARERFVSEVPEVASLVMVPRIRAAELQARLGPEETLVEYFAAGLAWYAFVVTREQIHVRPLGLTDASTLVLEARKGLAQPQGEAAGPALRLHRELIQPVEDLLKGRTLTLVPHGALHQLPWAALMGRETGLLDRFSLRVLPSASVLRFLKPRRPIQRALILGNPDLGNAALDLAFAQEEAETLAGILPKATLLLREKATAQVVRSAGATYDCLHLAAHGTFDPARPLDSALLLARGPDSEGSLKASELYALSLDTDLVTLSACETGLSKVGQGDEVVGFTRGLLFAGARSILSSLWTVDDQATKELMVAFYQGLGTLPKAEALRRAQVEVRARHPHPYYWAGFVLTGNGD